MEFGRRVKKFAKAVFRPGTRSEPSSATLAAPVEPSFTTLAAPGEPVVATPESLSGEHVPATTPMARRDASDSAATQQHQAHTAPTAEATLPKVSGKHGHQKGNKGKRGKKAKINNTQVRTLRNGRVPKVTCSVASFRYDERIPRLRPDGTEGLAGA